MSVRNGGHNGQISVQIYRGTTAISRESQTRGYDYGGSGILVTASNTISIIDSPNTTNATTYSVYYKKLEGDYARMYGASITLMEIAG